MKKPSFFNRLFSGLRAHKGWTFVIIVVVLIGAYIAYGRAKTANAEPQYVLGVTRYGSLRQTVAGSGQVSASNQTDIQSTVSGTIQSINVSVGQSVHAGQLIATIDSKNAAISLENARLALAKLTQPAKITDLSNATNTVSKAYNDAFDAASTAYLDLPAIMSGLKDMLYSQNGFLTDQKSTYLSSTGRTYRDTASNAYDAVVNQYYASLTEFKNLSRSSKESDLEKMFADTYATMKNAADAVAKAQNAITFITTSQPEYNPNGASTAASSVNSWATQANGDVTSILSAQNGISSAKNALTTLQNGADALDIQTAKLNLEQAQQSYDNYFIRAPYDGIIGRIPVNVYGQAGGSTVIATIIGQQKIASISLNEVDAAKIKVGQPVMITFDAIDGLNATGTVSQVDQVGTVTQGVVSYAVKILVNTADDRIKPGMSVNTTIITNQEDNVLLVPSSAVKTQGRTSYVQTFDRSVVMAQIAQLNGTQGGASTTRQFGGRFASSTRDFASTTRDFGSTTRTFSSTTRTFSGANANGQAPNLTISSKTLPAQTTVTIGDSDDTNTVILSGLTPGTFVVTRTIASGSAQASAPSILNTLGGNRGGAGGAAGGNRTFTAPGR